MPSVRRSQAARDEWNRANVLWTYLASFLERATGPQLVVEERFKKRSSRRLYKQLEGFAFTSELTLSIGIVRKLISNQASASIAHRKSHHGEKGRVARKAVKV